MATNKFVELNLSQAADLSSYTGIHWDLKTARDFAKMLLAANEQCHFDETLTDAMMTAALVRYARPFSKSNARRSLGEEALAALTPAQLVQHRYFRAIRDKYVAHSENDFEDSRPVARYWDDRVQEEGIEQIQCNHIRFLGRAIRMSSPSSNSPLCCYSM